MSHTIFIAVGAGCTVLILLVLCVICCRLLCVRKKKERRPEPDRLKRPTSHQLRANHYADPCHAMEENHYHSNDVTGIYSTPDVTYDKPQIYSTFINPSFYEDVYARWKQQEQTSHSRTYDSSWQDSTGRLKEQTEAAPVFKWSASSLRTLDAYDYEKYGRIPRSKLSSESEKDDADTVITETQDFTTF